MAPAAKGAKNKGKGRAKNAREEKTPKKSLSIVEAVARLAPCVKTNDALKAWIQSEQFAPFFAIFYEAWKKIFDTQPNKSKNIAHPTIEQVKLRLVNTEVSGYNNYTSAVDGPKALRSGIPLEIYCWVVANICEVNMKHEHGIFRSQLARARTSQRYEDVHYTVQLVIRSLGDKRQSLIPQNVLDKVSAVEIANAEQKEVEATEGVTIVWANRENKDHGHPLESMSLMEETPSNYLHNVQEPFEKVHTWVFRNIARECFAFGQMDPPLRIAVHAMIQWGEEEQSDELVDLSQSLWEEFCAKNEGQRGRIFMVVLTTQKGQKLYDELPDMVSALKQVLIRTELTAVPAIGGRHFQEPAGVRG